TLDHTLAPPPLGSPSMDIDATGVVHLLYNDGSGPVYAWRDGGGWHSEAFDTTTSYGTLRLDPKGRPCVAYVTPQFGLWFARRVAGTWQRTLVDGAHFPGGPKLAFNGVGRARIAYGAKGGVSAGGVGYAEEDDAAQWSSLAIPLAGNSVAELAIAAVANVPYIAFTSSSLLQVAWRESGTWNVATVDPETGAQHPSIVIDAAYEPVIAY